MILTRGEKQEGLGERRPSVGRAFGHQGSDRLGPFGTAGLTCCDNLKPGPSEHRSEMANLRRFAGTFTAFEGD
jgi:hypothetical protein